MNLYGVLKLKYYQKIFVIRKFDRDFFVSECNFISLLANNSICVLSYGEEVEINNEDAFLSFEEASNHLILKRAPQFFDISFVFAPYIPMEGEFKRFNKKWL